VYGYLPKKSVDRPVNDITVNDLECAERTDSTGPYNMNQQDVLFIINLFQ